jgi:hypothetical protein
VAAAQEDVEAVVAHGRVDTSSGACTKHWGFVSRCVVDVFGFALFDTALTVVGEVNDFGENNEMRKRLLAVVCVSGDYWQIATVVTIKRSSRARLVAGVFSNARSWDYPTLS